MHVPQKVEALRLARHVQLHGASTMLPLTEVARLLQLVEMVHFSKHDGYFS